MSDSGRQIGDCPHARTPEWCVDCLRQEVEALRRPNALLLKGMERQAEINDELKQQARRLQMEVKDARAVGGWEQEARPLGQLIEGLLSKLRHAERNKQAVEESAHTLLALKDAEIARMKDGNFTPDELQNLCHNLKPTDLESFRRGCESYQAKLFGLKKPENEEERQRLRSHYLGLTEPCCDCGKDYNAADLHIDGQVFCPECRGKG